MLAGLLQLKIIQQKLQLCFVGTVMSDNHLYSKLLNFTFGEKFQNFIELCNGYDGMEQLCNMRMMNCLKCCCAVLLVGRGTQ